MQGGLWQSCKTKREGRLASPGDGENVAYTKAVLRRDGSCARGVGARGASLWAFSAVAELFWPLRPSPARPSRKEMLGGYGGFGP